LQTRIGIIMKSVKLSVLTLLVSSAAWAGKVVDQTKVQTLNNTQTILTDSFKRTLYVFDSDKGAGKSTCNARCAEVWPPITLTAAEIQGLPQENPDLGIQSRDSGLSQLTYKGRPVYIFNQDRAEGDIKGNGVGGVWHLVEVK
jgi:predicted lipoprotein with Yx(FWY)xxD motif